VLFGDSLSDNGSGVKQLYNSTFPLPPYFNFRFSNGPIWIEYFPTTDLLDYAYGGAVLNQSISDNGPPSLMAQINDYLISNHFNLTSVAPDTLYIFWGGSNDIFDALASGANGTLSANALPSVLVSIPTLTASQIEKLISAGATNILVMLLPSWSNAPVVASVLTANQSQELSEFMSLLNNAIKSSVSPLANPKRGVNIQFFDIAAFTQTILDNPEAYGLTDVTNACFQNYEMFISGIGGAAPIVCPNPDEFLFWDGEHPTTKVQATFAVEIMKSIGWPQNL
jgi:phospholipase/lecithinase/hemolysin